MTSQIFNLSHKSQEKNNLSRSGSVNSDAGSQPAPIYLERGRGNFQEENRETTHPTKPTELSMTNEAKSLLEKDKGLFGGSDKKNLKKIDNKGDNFLNLKLNKQNTGNSNKAGGNIELAELNKNGAGPFESKKNLEPKKLSLKSDRDSEKEASEKNSQENSQNNSNEDDQSDDNKSNLDNDLGNNDEFYKERKGERQLIKMEKICDSETEDEGSDDDEKYASFVISADNPYKKLWDLFIAMLLIYSALVLPYKLAFIDEDNFDQKVWDTISDCVFFIDMILSFFSAYYDADENLVKNRKKIALAYFKTWFFIDLGSCIPLSFVEFTNVKDFTGILRVTKIPKLYRLVKLTKLFRMVKIAKKGNVNKITKYFLEKFKVNANVERLVYFVLIFLILNHLSACIWFYMATIQDMDPDCWVTRLGFIDLDNVELYINSFYWTLTTVTTVGYGDINAGTTPERIYNLVIMSFGVLMYSFAIGSLSSIVSTLDAKTAEMNQKLQILSSIKNEFKLDADIYDKVRKVIKYDLSRNQKDKMNFLQELPNKLRIELSKIMHDNVIQKLYFFRNQAQDFIAYVAPLLKPVKFCQNDFLYKTGDMIDEMYFIGKGTISFCLSKDYDEKEIKEIKKNNNFGEIEMCLNEQLTFDIKIKSRNCELFVLKKNDFLRLSVNYKEAIEKFLQRSLLIYLRFNEDKKKAKKSVENANMEKEVQDPTEAENKEKGKDDSLERIIEENDEDNEEENNEDESKKEDTVNPKKEEQDPLRMTNKKNTDRSKNAKGSSDSDSEEEDTPGKPKPVTEDKDKDLKGKPKNSQISSKKIDREKVLSLANNKQKLQSGKDVKEVEKNVKEQKNVERLKGEINKKFLKKLEKLMEFLSKTKIQFDNSETNPLLLLDKLKKVTDITERNEIIDQIESIVTNLFKIERKK